MALYMRGVRATLFKCNRYLGSSFSSIASSDNCFNVKAPLSYSSVNFVPSLNKLSQRHFHVSRTHFEIVTVNCPQFAESISEGDVRWEKAVGDTVEADEAVAEIETDKTGIPIPSPSAGTIEALLVEDGSTVQPGVPLFKLNTDGSAAAPAPKVDAKVEPPKVEPPKPVDEKPVETSSVKTSPIPTEMPPVPKVPTAPLSDKPKPSKEVLGKKPVEASSDVPADIVTRTEHRIKMNRMRQRISQRLKDAQNTAAMLTTFNEIDMTNIIAFRNRYKDSFQKKHGLKLSFMSAFIKASTYALKVRYFSFNWRSLIIHNSIINYLPK